MSRGTASGIAWLVGLAFLSGACANSPPEPSGVPFPQAEPEREENPPRGLCGIVEGQPEVFVESYAKMIALNNRHVFWSDESWIYQKSKKDGGDPITLNQSPPSSYYTYMVASEGMIFASDLENVKVYKESEPAQKDPVTKVKNEDYVDKFHVILSENRLFWLSKKGGYFDIRRQGKNLQAGTIVASQYGDMPDFLVTGRHVYYGTNDANSDGLNRIDHDGKGRTQIVSKRIGHLTSDGVWIYWLQDWKEIWRMARSGGEPERLTEGLSGVIDLVATGGCVYILQEDGIGRIPREGGQIARLTDQDRHLSMAVDAAHLYWSDPTRKLILRLPLVPVKP